MLAQIEAFLRRWLPRLRGRPAQLPHGGDRLHRRPAPLGVHRRAAGAALRRLRRHAGAAPRTGRKRLNDPKPDPRSLPDLPLFPLQSVLFPGAQLSLRCSRRVTSIWSAAACASSSRSARSACARAPRCAPAPTTAGAARDHRRAGAARRGRRRAGRRAARALPRHAALRDRRAACSRPTVCGPRRAWLIDDDAVVAPPEAMVPTVRALANAIGALEAQGRRALH